MGYINSGQFKKGQSAWNKGHTTLKEIKMEQARKRVKRWQQRNPDKIKKAYVTNREKVLKYSKEYHKISKEKWLMFLASIDFLHCHHCGYNDCFAAIDFHHIDPDIKETKVSIFWQRPITSKRVAELKKTIPLCANCHRALHAGYWILEKE